jgi:hypothetical protein
MTEVSEEHKEASTKCPNKSGAAAKKATMLFLIFMVMTIKRIDPISGEINYCKAEVLFFFRNSTLAFLHDR